MSGRLLVALVVVGSTAGACGSNTERAVPPPVSHAPRAPKARAVVVAREAVDRGVKIAWSTAAEGMPVAVAADRRGVVVIVDHEQVAALDAHGSVLWAADFDGVATAVPALVGDRVNVPFTRANGSGGCAGLDRATGELRWRYEAIVTGGIAVAAAGALVICVMQNGQTAAIAPSWGAPQWEFTFQGDVDSSTIEVPKGTSIAVDEANGVFAFVVRRGDAWHLSTRSVATGATRFDLGLDLGSLRSPSAPALIGAGFIGVSAGAGELCLVSVELREFQCVQISAGDGFDPATAPLRVENLVIVVGRAGDVTAIDLDTDRPKWTAHAAGAVRDAHLIVLGQVLMVQTWSGELSAFRLRDGAAIHLPREPGRAIGMLFSGGPGAAIAVGHDGDTGWVERWEPRPGT
jgi:outer membrane protein assembly factor BamB